MARTRTTLTALALALLIFGAGVVVGAAVDRHLFPSYVTTGPGFGHDQGHQLEAFRLHLSLSDEQAEEIGAIMKRTRAEAESIRAEERPRMEALHDRAQQAILEVLSDEQAEEYRKLMKHAHEVRVPHP